MSRIKKILVTVLFALFIPSGVMFAEASNNQGLQEDRAMEITLEFSSRIITFRLNDSTAAKELYNQLPMTVKVENYSTNEKYFHMPTKLNLSDASLAHPKKGTLAYYAPWGNIVMFYEDFVSNSGLYHLGEAILGKDIIENIPAGSIVTVRKK